MRNIRKRLMDLLKSELQKGLGERDLAAGISLGVLLGVFPIIGTSTFLCFVIAVLFRWNVLLVQAVNYLVYPFQFLLLPVWVFTADGLGICEGLGGRLATISLWDLFNWEQVEAVIMVLGCMVLSWAVISLPAGLILYVIALKIARTLSNSKK